MFYRYYKRNKERLQKKVKIFLKKKKARNISMLVHDIEVFLKKKKEKKKIVNDIKIS